ncbi:hypothetical protein AB0M95_40640 [Sphaerisporangium sp. NPDC051017]|uniref:hypothetical protein n=1 Tax=Sphaerisporangium sp. NPDC051017 TaxID=3154636 RepID=UPI00342B3EF2
MSVRDLGSAHFSHAEQRGLLLALAQALPGSWTIAEDRYGNGNRWELHEHNGVALRISLGPVQAAVCGIHEPPGDHRSYRYGLERPTIRFSLAKTSAQMAAEIVRRLLPAVRQDTRKLEQAIWRDELLTSRRLRTLRAAQRRLGGPRDDGLSWSQGTDRGRAPGYERASAYDLAGLHIAVEFTESSANGDHAALTVSRLSHAELLTVIQTVADLINARRAPQ